MPTYYFHSPHIWQLVREARDRAIAIVEKDPDATAADAITAIILSAAAAEGFINELAEFCIPKRPDEHHPESLVKFGQKIQELERERSATLDKYLATDLLSGTEVKKGENPYQSFFLLFKVRDMIIHVKAIDQSGPRDGEGGHLHHARDR